MQSIPGLFIAQTESKGRGVFTAQKINSGDLIEISPVIVVPASQKNSIHNTVLHDYYFNWGHDDKDAAIALGFVSIYNHADKPNADYLMFQEELKIEIRALEDIFAGQEITIDYGHNKQKLWFEVISS